MPAATETERMAAQLEGQTLHVLRGTRYVGAFTLKGVHEFARQGERVFVAWEYAGEPTGYSAALDELFTTEAEAREAAKCRRKPRQARSPQPLYGDFAQLASLHGLSTDGTGRKVARNG
jgi:hypothetical protein